MTDYDRDYVQAWIKRVGPLTLYAGRVRGRWRVALWLRIGARVLEVRGEQP